MKRLVILACFAISSFVVPAQGGVITTSNGSFVLQDPGAPGTASGPPLTGVASLSLASNGFGFVNQLTNGSPTPGQQVISATFTQLGGATGTPVGIGSPDFTPVSLANGNVGGLITVLQGTIIPGVSGATIRFDSGAAYVVDLGAFGTFGQAANGPLLNLSSVVAKYSLAGQSTVLSGFDQGAGSSLGELRDVANLTNVSSINPGLTTQAQSSLIFQETNIGPNFLSAVVDRTPALIGANILDSTNYFGGEVLLARPNFTTSAANGSGMTASILANLNLFAMDAVGQNFANSFGAGNDYNPNFTVSGSQTGDFYFTGLGGSVDVGHLIVPEPASMLVFAGLGLAGVFAARRKKA